MMNYKTMSNKDLKQYILENRSDTEALREYMSRPKSNSIVVAADASKEETERALKEAIKRASK